MIMWPGGGGLDLFAVSEQWRCHTYKLVLIPVPGTRNDTRNLEILPYVCIQCTMNLHRYSCMNILHMYYANCLRPDCISNGHTGTGIQGKGTTAKGRQKDDSRVTVVNTLPGYINNHTSCQIWLFSGRN